MNLKNLKYNLHLLPEWLFWTLALLALASTDVSAGPHFSICPLYLMGFEHCPGCGLGRAITLLLDGKMAASVAMHPLGPVALLIIGYRLVQLSYKFLNNNSNENT